MIKQSDSNKQEKVAFKARELFFICSIALVFFFTCTIAPTDVDALKAPKRKGVVVFAASNLVLSNATNAVVRADFIGYQNFYDQGNSNQISGVVAAKLSSSNTWYGQPNIDVDTNNNIHVVFPEINQTIFPPLPTQLHYRFVINGKGAGSGITLPPASPDSRLEAFMDVRVVNQKLYIAVASNRDNTIAYAGDLRLFTYDAVSGLTVIPIVTNDPVRFQDELEMIVDQSGKVHIVVGRGRFFSVQSLEHWVYDPVTGQSTSSRVDAPGFIAGNGGDMSISDDLNGSGRISVMYSCGFPFKCLAYMDQNGNWQRNSVNGSWGGHMTTIPTGSTSILMGAIVEQPTGTTGELKLRWSVNSGQTMPLQPSLTLFRTVPWAIDMVQMPQTQPNNGEAIVAFRDWDPVIRRQIKVSMLLPNPMIVPISKDFSGIPFNHGEFDVDLYH